jgi:hypothetical protein
MSEIGAGDRLQADSQNLFKDTDDGKIYRRVRDQAVLEAVQTIGAPGTILAGVTYDYIGASYPNAVTEVYSYKQGGSGGTLQATVTVTYTDSTKNSLVSVVKT